MSGTILDPIRSFGLRVQPMVHVPAMAAAVDFYAALGGQLVFGSRDGDWCLLTFGTTKLSLLAHPPGDGRRETVELQFTCTGKLEEIEQHLRGIDPACVVQGVSNEAFGRMLRISTPDGLLIKLLDLERDLII